MHWWSRVPSTAAGSRSSPAAAPRSSPSTTAASSASARSKRLGNFVQLQDAYGNTYTYARLAKVAKSYPAPRQRTTTAKQVAKELKLPAKDAAPTAPASATTEKATKRDARRQGQPRARRAARRSPSPPRRPPSPPSSACSPTRSGPTPGAQAASSRSSSAPARSTAALELQELLLEGLRPRPQGRPHQAPAPGLAGRGRHDPRPHRPDLEHARPRTCCSRSAPPAAAPRASIRSRSSTAGSCSSRPRSTARRARTRSSAPTPSSPRSARSC